MLFVVVKIQGMVTVQPLLLRHPLIQGIHSISLSIAFVHTANNSVSFKGWYEIFMTRSWYFLSFTAVPYKADNSAVSRCCPSMTKSLGREYILSLFPIWLTFSYESGASQIMTNPTGYPFNIESSKSLTLASDHTKGRCKSGNPIRPVRTSRSSVSTLLGKLSNNCVPIFPFLSYVYSFIILRERIEFKVNPTILHHN